MKKHKTIKWHFDGTCIRPTSHAGTKGYPHLSIKGKETSIARHILIRRHGELDDQMVTRHTCDNRWCINPDHVLLGTNDDNVADRVNRGRSWSKLTKEDVLSIRRSNERYKLLAARYGVGANHIWRVKNNYTWTHLKDE